MLNQFSSQIVALNQANVATISKITAPLLAGTEKLINLQLSATKALIEENLKLANALSDVKSYQAGSVANLPKPNLDGALGYLNSVYDVVSETQATVSQVIEASVKEFGVNLTDNVEKLVATAPAGAGSEAAVTSVKSLVTAANTAFDQFSKASKQVVELANTINKTSQANIKKAVNSN